MKSIVIHVGAPRTATTVIQKHLLRLCSKALVLSKKPFASSSGDKSRAEQIQDVKRLLGLKSLSGLDDAALTGIFNLLYICCRELSCQEPKGMCIKPLDHVVRILSLHNTNILISSERLLNTHASVDCLSSHRHGSDNRYPLYALINALRKAEVIPLISVCLRNPVEHLRSRYCRNLIQRKVNKKRALGPDEYIQKQSSLEISHPGTSALAPAFHSEFVGELQRYGFVKAFGFQDLIASNDVFSLIGLQGEKAYAFQDFPREHKLPFTKEEEQAIEGDIVEALKRHSLYDKLLRTQVYE